MEEVTNKQSNAGQGLGIAGLVLGIIALIISFIPCFGWYALVPGAIAIILSAIAFSQAKKAETAKGMIIAALIISIVATTIAIVQITFFAGVMKNAKDNIEQIENWSDEFKDHVNDEESVEKLEQALDKLEEKMDSAHIKTHKAVESAKKELKEAKKEMSEADKDKDDD